MDADPACALTRLVHRVAKGRPKTKRQWMRTADRRQQLLECAVRVFSHTGLGRGTHAAVAKEAHVSVATVFTHFDSREALVEAVVTETDRFFTEMIGGQLRGEGSARETMLALGRAFARSVAEKPDYGRVWLEWSTAVEGPHWQSWLAFQQRALRIIRVAIRRGRKDGSVPAGVDTDAAARIFNGASHIVALMTFAGHRPAEVDRFLVHLVDSALRLPLDAD